MTTAATGAGSGVRSISTEERIADASQGASVLFFWADFHPACAPGGQLDQLFAGLCRAHEARGLSFFKVNAEECEDAAAKYGVSAIPSFVFLRDGNKDGLLEGADPASLGAMVKNFFPSSAASTLQPTPSSITVASAAAGTSTQTKTEELSQSLRERLSSLISSAPIMLFMKGDPTEPKCKFSRAMVGILSEENVAFGSFNILSDPEVRQGLKVYSNWKTYPQLYNHGRLVGGLDTIKELRQKGPLSTHLKSSPEVTAEAEAGSSEASNDRLRALVNRAPVMLFMKGSPDEPRCGFSRQIVELLRSKDVAFSHFDILEDEGVRQGLKKFSDWPTYPQLYAAGELVGGLDIAKEMAAEGELLSALGVGLEARIKSLIGSSDVFLFMKGNPAEPRCGFSRQMVEILNAEGIKYSSFDILEDQGIRQAVKKFADWPTFPMLFHRQTLVGGIDIIKEMREGKEGKLMEEISNASS